MASLNSLVNGSQRYIPKISTNKNNWVCGNLDFIDEDDLPETPGIYIFTNIAGYGVYVGETVSIKKRFKSHQNHGMASQLTNEESLEIDLWDTSNKRELKNSLKRYCYHTLNSKSDAVIYETLLLTAFCWPLNSVKKKGMYVEQKLLKSPVTKCLTSPEEAIQIEDVTQFVDNWFNAGDDIVDSFANSLLTGKLKNIQSQSLYLDYSIIPTASSSSSSSSRNQKIAGGQYDLSFLYNSEDDEDWLDNAFYDEVFEEQNDDQIFEDTKDEILYTDNENDELSTTVKDAQPNKDKGKGKEKETDASPSAAAAIGFKRLRGVYKPDSKYFKQDDWVCKDYTEIAAEWAMLMDDEYKRKIIYLDIRTVPKQPGIYMYFSKDDDNDIKYIGQSSYDIRERHREHLLGEGYCGNVQKQLENTDLPKYLKTLRKKTKEKASKDPNYATNLNQACIFCYKTLAPNVKQERGRKNSHYQLYSFEPILYEGMLLSSVCAPINSVTDLGVKESGMSQCTSNTVDIFQLFNSINLNRVTPSLILGVQPSDYSTMDKSIGKLSPSSSTLKDDQSLLDFLNDSIRNTILDLSLQLSSANSFTIKSSSIGSSGSGISSSSIGSSSSSSSSSSSIGSSSNNRNNNPSTSFLAIPYQPGGPISGLDVMRQVLAHSKHSQRIYRDPNVVRYHLAFDIPIPPTYKGNVYRRIKRDKGKERI
ncbi:hypothetical protein DLAC_03538 [Tieghemostelium lacteum]|uniref:GIY-YIG domain-containing protein n=1 Tax=Tieghemostelium lacteum TaxID=361077 RepID=A0A152A1E8_TIELA|nr:hypothetical protein DLAC_03538 [Tieghemostelium lacteum]|eukprot:KYR00040.1 hypothetical protein DLAC_03538 [Tieghemostelium lacteum]